MLMSKLQGFGFRGLGFGVGFGPFNDDSIIRRANLVPETFMWCSSYLLNPQG